jgi:hypothetical protein
LNKKIRGFTCCLLVFSSSPLPLTLPHPLLCISPSWLVQNELLIRSSRVDMNGPTCDRCSVWLMFFFVSGYAAMEMTCLGRIPFDFTRQAILWKFFFFIFYYDCWLVQSCWVVMHFAAIYQIFILIFPLILYATLFFMIADVTSSS